MSEGSEEVLLACGRGSINYFNRLMQILKLDFVPLSYMWFVVAVENALSTLKALLKRNNLFKAGRIVQKISYLFLSKLL